MLNVVVDPSCRRQGIGQALMQGAADFARIEWGAASMYTHVQADNEVAPSVQSFHSTCSP